MARSKDQAGLSPEQTLEELLDRVSNAREELVAIENALERLRADITKTQKQKAGMNFRRLNLADSPLIQRTSACPV